MQAAYPKLLKSGVKVLRPSDYYAEMAKSDNHMQKVSGKRKEIEINCCCCRFANAY